MAAGAAEYRESQAIEKLLKDNPAARQAWVKRQLEMELVDRDLPESNGEQHPPAKEDRPTEEPLRVGK